jgi:hypothetical protein
MTTDRELLELAAKAAGIEVWWNGRTCFVLKTKVATHEWNPLTDDGEALRLAVELRLTIQHNYSGVFCYDSPDFSDKSNDMIEVWENHADPYAATRRAIVRAAAEIGKGIGGGE